MTPQLTQWLESAADLLAEGDPGPTPFLVENLLVERGIAALVGPYKVGKTWLLLELAISVATHLPAFGRLETKSGPVMLILEESGRDALSRRLRKLARGRGIESGRLANLHFAANRGVNLSEQEWKERVLDEARRLSPALIAFDPLARVKGSADESSQSDISPVLNFLRELREASGATVLFVHHEGHVPGRMRGSSDLEAYWESRITIRSAKGGYEAHADHREASSPEALPYSLDFDEDAGTAALLPAKTARDELTDLVLEYVRENPGAGRTEIRNNVPRRAGDVVSRLDELVEAGTVSREPSQRRDSAGQGRSPERYFLTAQAALPTVPLSGHNGPAAPFESSSVPVSRPFRAGHRTDDEGNESAGGQG